MTRAIRPLSYFSPKLETKGVTFVSFLSQLFYLTSEMGAKMTKVMAKDTLN